MVLQMLINILAEGCTQSWVTWSGRSCFESEVWVRQSPKVLSHKNCSVLQLSYSQDYPSLVSLSLQAVDRALQGAVCLPVVSRG